MAAASATAAGKTNDSAERIRCGDNDVLEIGRRVDGRREATAGPALFSSRRYKRESTAALMAGSGKRYMGAAVAEMGGREGSTQRYSNMNWWPPAAEHRLLSSLVVGVWILGLMAFGNRWTRWTCTRPC